MMKDKSRALTLVELITTIVVLSVIATISIPALQKYTIRARVKTVIDSGMAAQMQVTDELLDGGPRENVNYDSGKQSFTQSKSPYVKSITVTQGDVKVDAVDSSLGLVNFNVEFKSVEVTGDILWHCITPVEHHPYVPENCRCTWYENIEWEPGWSIVDQGFEMIFVSMTPTNEPEPPGMPMGFDCFQLSSFCSATGLSDPGPPENQEIVVSTTEKWKWSSVHDCYPNYDWPEFSRWECSDSIRSYRIKGNSIKTGVCD